MTQVTVRSITGHTHAHSITDGRHTWVSDEPPSSDGDDLGPGPYELLLSALGACTAITLQMYAKRKQWPLEQVTAELRHEKLPENDPSLTDEERAGATDNGFVDVIRLNLTLRGDLTADQTERLRDIASRCPMRRTLMATPKVIASASSS
jgi:putative redox protein